MKVKLGQFSGMNGGQKTAKKDYQWKTETKKREQILLPEGAQGCF